MWAKRKIIPEKRRWVTREIITPEDPIEETVHRERRARRFSPKPRGSGSNYILGKYTPATGTPNEKQRMVEDKQWDLNINHCHNRRHPV